MVECRVQEYIIRLHYVNKEESLEWWLFMGEEDKLKKIIMDLKENFQLQH